MSVVQRTLLFLVAICIAACTTTAVKAVWKDEAYQTKPKRFLVIAMFKNQTVRRLVEDEFRNYLKYSGADAATGYDEFPGNDLPTKEAVMEKLKAGGYDAFLITRVTDSRTEHRTVSSSAPLTPGAYGGGYGGYYGHGYTAVHSMSYTVEDQFTTVEASLYDIATEKLVWTATTETWIAEGQQKLVRTYVAVMMDSLQKNGLVRKK